MGTQTQPVTTVPTEKVVTDKILAVAGLNPQSFGGAANPSNAWRMMVGDQVTAFPIYRELMEKDTAVSSAFETRRNLAMAQIPTASIVSANKIDASAKFLQKAAAAFIDSLVEFDEVLRELLSSRAYGYKVMETPWEVAGREVIVNGRIIGHPQEIFRFGATGEPQNGPLRLVSPLSLESKLVPEERFLISTFNMENGSRVGHPILRKVFWPSWFKRNGQRIDLQFLEKPSGTIAVTYSPGASDEDKKLALDAAQAINDEVAVAIPENFKIMAELLAKAKTRDGKDYSEFIQDCRAEITRSILGQTLTSAGSEQGSGSRSLGEVHLSILYEVRRSDLAHLETVVNQQLLGRWLLWMFGPQALERDFRPWWRVDKNPPKDRKAAIDALRAASEMVPVKQEQVYEEAQVQEPEAGDPVVAPPQLPPELTGTGEDFGPVRPAGEDE